MAGLNVKSFLLKVMGQRSNLGHLWLSACSSFVIAHLRACVHLIVGSLSGVWFDPCGEQAK